MSQLIGISIFVNNKNTTVVTYKFDFCDYKIIIDYRHLSSSIIKTLLIVLKLISIIKS